MTKLSNLTKVTTAGDDTLFYLVDPDRPVGDKSVGMDKDDVAAFIGGGAGGNTIYTGDGALTENRDIDIDEHSLNFINDNDVRVAIQSKTETSEDDGNINIYSANDVKQLDIDAEYDDGLTGKKGTYFGMYNGFNGAVGFKQRIHTNLQYNEWKLYEYDEGNFGPITDPTSEPLSVIQMEARAGGVSGLSLNHSTARFRIGSDLTDEPTYRFYNSSNSLFGDDVDIVDGTIDITNTTDNKRFEMPNAARVRMYGANTSSGAKTVDIDGDDAGGGFIGVYASNTASPDRGVVMHSAPDNDINFLRVYQLGGFAVGIDLKSELIGGVPTNSAVINGKVTANVYKSKVTTSTGVTGTYDIDYDDADTYDLTLTGATTLTESNAPTTGNTQTVVIFATGGDITLPSSGTNFTTGTYDGSKDNWIVIKYFNTKRIITITQAD